MNIWPLSDLHLEFEDISSDFYVPEDADICVCTGDIVSRSPAKGVKWLAEHVKIPTIYVAGNHEFYNGSLKDGIAEAKLAAEEYPHIHYLEDDTIIIDGVRFIGCTLWTDYNVMGGDQYSAMQHARNNMNDFRRINFRNHPYTPLQPSHLLNIHLKSKEFIKSVLSEPFDGKTVLVTHHGIHPLSIHKNYAGDKLNSSFVSNLDEMIYKYRPHLCLHGHVHNSFDYDIGDTHVIVNPKGYYDENKEYEFELMINLNDDRYDFIGGER